MASSSSQRPSAPVTKRGQRTRQKVLDAAEQIFGTVGYERASIVEITRTAGVAQGTFYVYFPSKKAVFVELVWELNHRLRRSLREATEALVEPDRRELERTGAKTFLRFVKEHQNLYRIVRQAEFVDEQLYREYYEKLSAGYREGLARSMDAEEIRALDPDTTVWMLMGILDFLGMRYVLWNGEVPDDAVIDEMMTFVFHGLSREEP